MANIYYDEEFMVDGNIFKYEKRIHSPVVRMQSKNMTLCTYYHLSDEDSTADPGFQDILKVTGSKSPLRFNKIEKFPLYEMEQINIQISDEEQGLDMGYEGECTILPDTIKPLPDSFFYINHVGRPYIFKVVGVSPDTLMRDGYYKIQYKLEYVNEDKLEDLDAQTVCEYECIIDNIGTENNCLIEKRVIVKARDIEAMVDKIRDLYVSIFYSERYNCFLGDCGSGHQIYDPLQSVFVNTTGIFNTNRNFNTLMLSVECLDNKSKLRYEKSVYKFIQQPDKVNIRPFCYVTYPAISKPENQFSRWMDMSVQVVDCPPYIEQIKHYQIFSREFVNAVISNTALENSYAELLRRYIRTPDKVTIDDISTDLYNSFVDMDANLEVFFIAPLIIYVIKEILKNVTKIKK